MNHNLLITDILFLLLLCTFRKKLDLDDNHDEKKRFLLGQCLSHGKRPIDETMLQRAFLPQLNSTTIWRSIKRFDVANVWAVKWADFACRRSYILETTARGRRQYYTLLVTHYSDRCHTAKSQFLYNVKCHYSQN